MRIVKIWLAVICIILAYSCKNVQQIFTEECNIEQEKYSKFFADNFQMKFLTNLEDAIDCSKTTKRPIFIMFANYPLSGIYETVKRSYQNQVSYLFNCKSCLKTILEEYIPVLLYTDISTKIDFNETSNPESQKLLNEIIDQNLFQENEQLNSKSKYYGKFCQKLQIAATQSNSTHMYLIIENTEKVVPIYGSNIKTLKSQLKK